ncbi:MAG: histidine phosphatase family protein [Myxococcota bacterium]
MALLTLIRHGETAANSDGVWAGSTDTPLSERGHAQAKRVAEYLLAQRCPAVAIYASDLCRARDTALPIAEALGLELQIERDLREYHLGSWEGRPYRELHEVERLWHHMREDPDFAPHGGETPLGVAKRLGAALERIASAHRGEQAIVVTHGGAMSMALGALLDGDYSSWRRVVDNCALSDLRLRPTPELLRFNETSHLEGL